MISRLLQSQIESKLFKGKAIIITGPRQVGKTTLLRRIADSHALPSLWLNCDEPEVRQLLTDTNVQQLQSLIGRYRMVVIDEAQRVRNIGLSMKLIVDTFPQVQLLVTGSSSLDLANEVNEPLTGRKYTYQLYPFAFSELSDHHNWLAEKQMLDTRLIYGSYPDVVNHAGEEKEILLNISESYLYKDILSLAEIRKPLQLERLLMALALQVGSEVSYNELAQTIQSNVATVERYVHLLEQCFVVFRLGALSRNLRNEIKKSKKIYFYDNGIRNSILQNFAPLTLRQDVGQLWENYLIAERLKANHYYRHFVKSYFWRTFQQQEIDLIEEADGMFSAYEIKWNESRRSRIPESFGQHYPVREQQVVTPNNYQEFLCF
ncbi:MAG: ATP-binding protein [Prevotellaceae bacterium]|nr:ATP-binding protein [Prevotellaceae bacterium]